jgi:hypothetical protein
MFAIQKWIRPLEEDAPDDWKFDAYVNHKDMRSIDDTMLNYTRNPELQVIPAHVMMPGLGETLDELFAFKVWTGNEDSSTIIETAQPVWEEFINRLNEK